MIATKTTRETASVGVRKASGWTFGVSPGTLDRHEGEREGQKGGHYAMGANSWEP